MPSPRALLGVAPAIVVLVGSFMMSRACLRENSTREAVESDASRSEVVVSPTAEDDERLHRVALKQEAVDDLLGGQLTLDEAVERFEMLSESPEARANLRTARRAGLDDDPAVNQVLLFARVRAAQDPKRFAAALARLEAEAHSPVTSGRAAN